MFAINGFGRIGRNIFKAHFERVTNGDPVPRISVVNCGMGKIEDHVHLLKYDSVHGRFNDVEIMDSNTVIVHKKHRVKFIFEPDPAKINWVKYGAEIVIEATGKFLTRSSAEMHLAGGAKRVILSAPAKDKVDATIVYGVNDKLLRTKDRIISAGSCTTNCLSPMLAALMEGGMEIESGFMTTVHAYTSDQNLVDGDHSDKRRARAAALSMIPASTGAAKTIGLIIPSLDGKLDGAAVRVPTANVSMVDLSVVLKSSVTVKKVDSAMEKFAVKSPGVLGVEAEPLVSIDFTSDPRSAIYDKNETRVVGGRLLRVVAWYDNECGFSNRVLDIIAKIA